MGLQGYTKDDLEGLTPEELSALEAEQGDEDGTIAELAAGADDEGNDTLTGGEGADTVQDAAGDDTVQGAAPAAAPAADTPAAAAPAAPTPAPGPHPVTYRANVEGDTAAGIQEQRTAITAARAKESEALKKLNDGEIDFEEYQKVRQETDTAIDAANDKILELRSAQTRVQVATELTTQQQERAWKTMLQDYVSTAKEAGLDYQGNEALRTEFNGLVKAFAIEASGRGMTDDDNMAASRYALEQAASIMAARHPKPAAAAPAAGKTAAPAPAAGAPAAAAAAAAPAVPAAARHSLQTLGAMPSAAPGMVADDPMQRLGGLQGEELELALAKMAPGDVERLLAGA